MEIYNLEFDNVISSIVGLGQTDYAYTLERIYPLINKLDEQRKLLNTKFYKRLEKDILSGCLMPPLTLAFVKKEGEIRDIGQLSRYVNENIDNGFILDGIQRLNTLKRASESPEFDYTKKIFFNIIIAGNKDKLLYRMITLNNGQKGMTPRHQIEILTKELFYFSGLSIKVQTEKDKAATPLKESFSYGDIAKGYMAFLTNNVNNENSKIIEEKMDEILVGRILENDISKNQIEFYDIIQFVDRHADSSICLKWFQTVNNFIGFCVGFNNSYDILRGFSSGELEAQLQKFELAFRALNPSKINLGKFRRELSKEFVYNLKRYRDLDVTDVEEIFFELTSTDD
ncbi:hypothetical protein F5984_19910 [Rudanella paleaurantiibacter]|uniref:DUF262 domain-containing protein n=1 Tax=Rudanella paleaurantiibacter TaxID=2614655 RepID=A0A7J5TVR2_9BACT|nr:hypothetical protein [Rudanella paleaurantiibacter]KAB7728023.1 hypothetical protein F5984_19910 [Rudanella paleaurantiibacter]